MLALAVYLVAMFGTFVRWFFLVRVIEPKFKFSATVLLGLIGMVFNLVIPGAVGGDLIKAAYLARMRIRKTQAIASMVIDRILGLLGLFILASIAGAFAWGLATPDVRKLIMAAWVAVGMGVLVLVVIFSQVLTRMFPQLTRGTFPAEPDRFGAARDVDDVSRPAGRCGRGGRNLRLHSRAQCRGLLPCRPDALPRHDHDARPALLDGSPDALQHGRAPPFRRLGLSEGVGQQLFKLVGHPSGALAMMGFRVLMYAGAATARASTSGN